MSKINLLSINWSYLDLPKDQSLKLWQKIYENLGSLKTQVFFWVDHFLKIYIPLINNILINHKSMGSLDGTQFLWLSQYPENQGGYRIMKTTVCPTMKGIQTANLLRKSSQIAKVLSVDAMLALHVWQCTVQPSLLHAISSNKKRC